MHNRMLSGIAAVAIGVVTMPVTGQSHVAIPKDQGEFSRYVGDAPRHAPPYARDLSSQLTHADVEAALRRVADWQLQRSRAHFDRDWTFAVLYAGFMALPTAVHGETYRDAMRSMGEEFQWQPQNSDFSNRDFANDQAVEQTYVQLAAIDHRPAMLQPTRAQMDAMLGQFGRSDKGVWWWCDALFMAPPVLAELSRQTSDCSYLDFMDREWRRTSTALYDPDRHLFYRDTRFLTRKEANGAPVFWARGNGWALAGLARVLQAMPEDYPSRPFYVAQFREMSEALISTQQEDGLWRAGLLDPKGHPMPEASGTSLITYGLAYGVHAGLLDHATYLPHIERAWTGLVAHIYADGRLGSIQPVGDAPGGFKPTSSYVYGVGGFLLAGSEIDQLCAR